jgi:hypothetical protein
VYHTAHERVKDNAKKLLVANKKGAKEYKRVSALCSAGMARYNVAEKKLLEAVDHLNRSLLKKERDLVDAAIRYRDAFEANRGNPNMLNSRMIKDPKIDEYFASDNALFEAVKKLKK